MLVVPVQVDQHYTTIITKENIFAYLIHRVEIRVYSQYNPLKRPTMVQCIISHIIASVKLSTKYLHIPLRHSPYPKGQPVYLFCQNGHSFNHDTVQSLLQIPKRRFIQDMHTSLTAISLSNNNTCTKTDLIKWAKSS